MVGSWYDMWAGVGRLDDALMTLGWRLDGAWMAL